MATNEAGTSSYKDLLVALMRPHELNVFPRWRRCERGVFGLGCRHNGSQTFLKNFAWTHICRFVMCFPTSLFFKFMMSRFLLLWWVITMWWIFVEFVNDEVLKRSAIRGRECRTTSTQVRGSDSFSCCTRHTIRVGLCSQVLYAKKKRTSSVLDSGRRFEGVHCHW